MGASVRTKKIIGKQKINTYTIYGCVHGVASSYVMQMLLR